MLLDLTHVDPAFIGSHQRRLLADAAKRRSEGFERTLLAEARVVSGPVVRAISASLDWLVGRPSTHPVEHFDDVCTAETWLVEQLAMPRDVGGQTQGQAPLS